MNEVQNLLDRRAALVNEIQWWNVKRSMVGGAGRASSMIGAHVKCVEVKDVTETREDATKSLMGGRMKMTGI